MQHMRDIIALIERVTQANVEIVIAPGGWGADVNGTMPKSGGVSVPVAQTVGNEPFKDDKWFASRKADYITTMVKAIRNGEDMPPILAIEHPADPTSYVVVDGNHRLHAHKVANAKTIPAVVLSHENVNLYPKPYGEESVPVPLTDFRGEDGRYDMTASRPELEGKSLLDYFVRPDGSHNFPPVSPG